MTNPFETKIQSYFHVLQPSVLHKGPQGNPPPIKQCNTKAWKKALEGSGIKNPEIQALYFDPSICFMCFYEKNYAIEVSKVLQMFYIQEKAGRRSRGFCVVTY